MRVKMRLSKVKKPIYESPALTYSTTLTVMAKAVVSLLAVVQTQKKSLYVKKQNL